MEGNVEDILYLINKHEISSSVVVALWHLSVVVVEAKDVLTELAPTPNQLQNNTNDKISRQMR